MDTLAIVMRYEVAFVVLSLALVIAYRMFTRQINTKELLQDKVGGRGISPGRLQMFMVTFLMAIYFLVQVGRTSKFPQIAHEYLFALGGSHLFYLGGKLQGLLAKKLEDAANRIMDKSL